MDKGKVLVAGGAGFIGSWLCEELLKQNFGVICVDNLCTGREQNVSNLKQNKNFEFINHDITKPLPESLGKIDFIFHLASPASPPAYQKLAIETLLVNSNGTLNLLELARKNNAVFLFASTSEVYGNPMQHPQKETYWGNVNPNGIRSMYDESKRFGEALCMAYLRKYNIDLRIARIFNTYGPRMRADDGRVISNFINQSLQNKPLTIYGDGKQTRSLCYISDLAEGLLSLMFAEGIKGEVVNLGNSNERTIIELADIIKRLTNSKSDILFKDLPQDDPERRCPDISKAEKFLNWTPRVNLEEGLEKTVEWYKDNL
jgi:nucleoside-diphosphate-sugar epimerase